MVHRLCGAFVGQERSQWENGSTVCLIHIHHLTLVFQLVLFYGPRF